jgi:opacity protein-like surface antigen
VKKRLLVAALAGVLLGSCSSSADVDWENYAPEVRTRIDRMAAEGDCDGLQAEFDTADANDAAQRDRVGTGNADLMGYIDGKLSEAGCYG